jgi:hypothetical protein
MKPGQLFKVDYDDTPVWNSNVAHEKISLVVAITKQGDMGLVIQQDNDDSDYVFALIGGTIGYVSAWYLKHDLSVVVR